ncbi:hypothetical protein J3P89_16285 [Pseudomonas sp. Z1-14]|uniref:hypothetical protein n=1 Tax=Pseudomonas sp. Z1-14 TaxID=2817409 RepID=UPI003DA8D2CB
MDSVTTALVKPDLGARTALSYTYVAVLFAMGASMAFFAPLMLGVIAAQYSLSLSAAGGIVTLEMVLTSVTVFALAKPLSRLSLSRVSTGAAAIALSVQLVSCLDLSLGAFVAIRAISGIACGFLYAGAVYWASLHRHGVRMMASAFFLANLLTGVCMGILPMAIEENGAKVFFYSQVILFVLPLLISFFSGNLVRPGGAQFVQRSMRGSSANWFAIKLLLVCSVLCNLAMAMLWTYSEFLAQVRDFDAKTIGIILGLTTLFSIGGSILAGIFDRRLGVVMPLSIGLLVGALAGVMMSAGQSLFLYATAMFLYGAAAFFVMPFVIGSASALDSGGCAANLVGGAAFLAGAVAPALGGLLSDVVSGDAVGWTACASCVLAAICVFIVRRSLDAPQLTPSNKNNILGGES